MRRCIFFLLILSLALPAFSEAHRAAEQVTVPQLEQTLAATAGKSDKQVAQQLSELVLTERLSESRRARLQAALPGPESRQALMTLTDASEFLDLPETDIPTTPVPSHAEQIALLSQARGYVMKTILKLPNFFATRETVNFEGTPGVPQGNALHPPKFEPMHEVNRSSVTVLYRDNREMVVKGKKQEASNKEMRTMGEFGPILVTILNDAAKGRVTWSHWEQGAAGPMAVFRYAIPVQVSHYLVASSGIGQPLHHDPAYHGEIALNPADGSILRLTAIAEPQADDPVSTADLLVDYGPVKIGGVPYICPTKSVAFSVVRMVIQELDFDTGAVTGTSLGPSRTYLNEVLFTQYHLFRAETRILTGSNQEPDAVTPANPPK
ncbi:MAG TPA: hypothetical protein VGG56_02185 [Terracidiphilus sp.]|jgi:hypothetical protein